MKICKVKLIKRVSGNICENIYPVGYNANKINVVAYDELPLNAGDNIGYCIGLVSDNFLFTADMVDISKSAADIFIDDRASIITDNDDKSKFATTRKSIITDAGITQ